VKRSKNLAVHVAVRKYRHARERLAQTAPDLARRFPSDVRRLQPAAVADLLRAVMADVGTGLVTVSTANAVSSVAGKAHRVMEVQRK
jgi:hypothetical protein